FHVCLLIPSPPRPLYSFPTRRSSDLYLPCLNSHQQEPYALNALQTYLVIISDWDKGNITTNFIKMYDRLLIYQQPRRLVLNHRGKVHLQLEYRPPSSDGNSHYIGVKKETYPVALPSQV